MFIIYRSCIILKKCTNIWTWFVQTEQIRPVRKLFSLCEISAFVHFNVQSAVVGPAKAALSQKHLCFLSPEVTSLSLPVFVVERSSSRRASEEGWKLSQRELGQPDWVCPHQRGLCCGPGQRLEVPLPLLQKWRRYDCQCRAELTSDFLVAAFISSDLFTSQKWNEELLKYLNFKK